MTEPTLSYIGENKVSLEEAQRIVGGYVERIALPDKRILLVDEDGRIKGLPRNNAASAAFGIELVGNVLCLSGKARKGWA